MPLLLRNWLQLQNVHRDLLGKPVPCLGRDKALKAGGIEGRIAAAVRPGSRALMIVLDGEYDQVCTLGPNLLARAKAVSPVPVTVCLADPKYEAWLVASAETLQLPGLAPNDGRDPGTAIKTALQPSKYVKPTWQPRLTARMDIRLACGRDASLARTLERFMGLVRLCSSG
jgi:hypothetical protein